METHTISHDASRSQRREGTDFEPFPQTLSKHCLTLERSITDTLQINLGLLCNQFCRHCHLSAGPRRTEMMTRETMDDVISFAERGRFKTVDITGGAPELNPHLEYLIEGLSDLATRIMLRSNLTALDDVKRDSLIHLLKKRGIVIVASFPSLNEAQAESQRGSVTFRTGIRVLRRLNELGYGHGGSGLELNLVSNPTGAFLPPSQSQAEKRFRQILEKKWGITFNHLFNFANVPLGRFKDWLLRSENYEKYINKLISCFNPCAIEGLMCRSLVSVSWEGYLFDCDFNLARGIYLGGRKVHVSEIPEPPSPGSPIAVAEHCYTCTAGTGFT